MCETLHQENETIAEALEQTLHNVSTVADRLSVLRRLPLLERGEIEEVEETLLRVRKRLGEIYRKEVDSLY